MLAKDLARFPDLWSPTMRASWVYIGVVWFFLNFTLRTFQLCTKNYQINIRWIIGNGRIIGSVEWCMVCGNSNCLLAYNGELECLRKLDGPWTPRPRWEYIYRTPLPWMFTWRMSKFWTYILIPLFYTLDMMVWKTSCSAKINDQIQWFI